MVEITKTDQPIGEGLWILPWEQPTDPEYRPTQELLEEAREIQDGLECSPHRRLRPGINPLQLLHTLPRPRLIQIFPRISTIIHNTLNSFPNNSNSTPQHGQPGSNSNPKQ